MRLFGYMAERLINYKDQDRATLEYAPFAGICLSCRELRSRLPGTAALGFFLT